MGSQNKGIKIQKNNGFTRMEVLYYRKTMGSQNRGIIIWKNNGFTEQRYYNIEKNGFTEQRYYNIEKQWVHRKEVL